MAEYIERQKLESDFKLCNKQNPRWTPQRVASLIAREPAADVAPVVRGKWIAVEDPFMNTVYDCSACKETFCFIEGDPRENLYSYCPNCGADMRVGEGEKLESHSKEDGE